MSRIRGIEAKVQKEVLQTRRNGSNENNKKKNEDQSFSTLKDDVESVFLFYYEIIFFFWDIGKNLGKNWFEVMLLLYMLESFCIIYNKMRWLWINRAADQGAAAEAAEAGQAVLGVPQDRRGYVQLGVPGLAASARGAARSRQALVRHQAPRAHGTSRSHRTRAALFAGHRVSCNQFFFIHNN